MAKPKDQVFKLCWFIVTLHTPNFAVERIQCEIMSWHKPILFRQKLAWWLLGREVAFETETVLLVHLPSNAREPVKTRFKVEHYTGVGDELIVIYNHIKWTPELAVYPSWLVEQGWQIMVDVQQIDLPGDPKELEKIIKELMLTVLSHLYSLDLRLDQVVITDLKPNVKPTTASLLFWKQVEV